MTLSTNEIERRLTALKDGKADGKRLYEISRELGVSYCALNQFARINGIHFGRPVNPDATVEVMASVKETAIANRSRASARQIGAALGVSRNTIIGHWFRSRESAISKATGEAS